MNNIQKDLEMLTWSIEDQIVELCKNYGKSKGIEYVNAIGNTARLIVKLVLQDSNINIYLPPTMQENIKSLTETEVK